jgi:hypothetical protein
MSGWDVSAGGPFNATRQNAASPFPSKQKQRQETPFAPALVEQELVHLLRGRPAFGYSCIDTGA